MNDLAKAFPRKTLPDLRTTELDAWLGGLTFGAQDQERDADYSRGLRQLGCVLHDEVLSDAPAADRRGVAVWNVQTGDRIIELPAHTNVVTSLSWSHDSHYLAMPVYLGETHVQNGLTVFDTQSGSIAFDTECPPVSALRFHPSGLGAQNKAVLSPVALCKSIGLAPSLLRRKKEQRRF